MYKTVMNLFLITVSKGKKIEGLQKLPVLTNQAVTIKLMGS